MLEFNHIPVPVGNLLTIKNVHYGKEFFFMDTEGNSERIKDGWKCFRGQRITQKELDLIKKEIENGSIGVNSNFDNNSNYISIGK
jgi:hypothetical protein